MLMLSRITLTACFILLAGCLDDASNRVKSFIPNKINSDAPIIAQIDKQYKTPLFTVGAEFDRQRNQSVGLGLISHVGLETYINDQLALLKKASGFESVPGRAYLFADTSFGARASADGNIYIPYAVILDLESTDELAALLAHELAHTIRGHSNSDLFVMVQKKALSASALVASLRKTDAGGLRESDLKMLQKAFGSVMVSDGFISPGWTRMQEEEADKLGLDIMIAAGHNPDGMFALLDKVDQWEEKNQAQQHDRNAFIENALGSIRLTNDETALGKTLNSYFNQGATKFGAFVDNLSKDHDSAVSRYDGLLKYADLHYANVSAPALKTQGWNAVAHSSNAKSMLHALQGTDQAREAIARGDLGLGEKLIRKVVSKETNSQNFLRQTFYELRAAQNKKSSMGENLKIGLAGQYPSLFLHIESMKLKEQGAGKLSAADTKSLLSVFDAYARPPDYYNQVVTLLDNAGMTSQVLALQTECMAKYMGEGISCSAGSTAEEKGNDYSYKGLMKSLL